MTTASYLLDEITGERIDLEFDDADIRRCDGPVFTASLDTGFPAPRAVGYDNPNANGFTDMTKHWGERVVSWSGWVVPAPEAPYPAVVWDKIRALTAPARRPWLYCIEDGWTDWRRIQLRGDTLQAPLTREYGPVIIGQVAWKATNGGTLESADERDYHITPSGQSTGGMCFPSTGACFDDACGPHFTEGYIGSTTIVYNYGDVIVYPMIVFAGYVVNPVIKNLTTDQVIKLNGTITEGAEIWVDTQNKTVRENNDPNLNRLAMYDFTESNWMHLVPGENRIDYSFEGTDPGECTMLIRDRWI